jgi:hypothetical protein
VFKFPFSVFGFRRFVLRGRESAHFDGPPLAAPRDVYGSTGSSFRIVRSQTGGSEQLSGKENPQMDPTSYLTDLLSGT